MPKCRPHCSHKMEMGRILKAGVGVGGRMRGVGYCSGVCGVGRGGATHVGVPIERGRGAVISLCGGMYD